MIKVFDKEEFELGIDVKLLEQTRSLISYLHRRR